MRAGSRKTPYRAMGIAAQGLGVVATIAGAGGLIVAAAMPWATLTLFGTPIAIPGMLGMGIITAALGVVTLAQFSLVRRFPWLGIALGIVACGLGVRAERETGALVVRYLLKAQVRLAVVNARLAQAALPPLEPFGEATGTRRDHTGPGPDWTIRAGVAVAIGSGLLLIGGRLRRTCAFCKRAWSGQRGDAVAFCPHCGRASGPMETCARCATPWLAGERFCTHCGEKRVPHGNLSPTGSHI
jgi:hypothetical protein